MDGEFRKAAGIAILAVGLPHAVIAASSPSTIIQASAAGDTSEPAPNPAGTGTNTGYNTTTPNPAGSTMSGRVPGEPPPTGSPPPVGLFPVYGAELRDFGIEVHGLVFDHFLASTTVGSVPQQTSNILAFAPEIDFDLQRLLGLTGAHLHVVETVWGLRSDQPFLLFDLAGELTGYQSTPISHANYLSVLTLEEDLLNGALSIEAGRTNAYRYFWLPNGLDVFNDESTTLYAGGDFSPIPYPVWGAVVKYHLDPSWYLQGGAFEDNYNRSVDNNYMFGTSGASGVQVLGEVNYRSEFATSRYPSNMEIGLEYNTRNGETNVKATPLAYSPALAAADYSGGAILYAQGLQVVWRGRDRPVGPPANIAVYGSAAVATNQQPFKTDEFVGLNFNGFWPGRPFDAFGVQVHYQRMSAVEAKFETMAETLVGHSTGKQQQDGFAFEALYNITATPWLTVQPIVQYFVNPDAYALSAQRRPSDGFMFGISAIVPIGRLLGTSEMPF